MHMHKYFLIILRVCEQEQDNIQLGRSSSQLVNYRTHLPSLSTQPNGGKVVVAALRPARCSHERLHWCWSRPCHHPALGPATSGDSATWSPLNCSYSPSSSPPASLNMKVKSRRAMRLRDIIQYNHLLSRWLRKEEKNTVSLAGFLVSFSSTAHGR